MPQVCYMLEMNCEKQHLKHFYSSMTLFFFCQLFHILALLMPEFWATYGPQTPTDMWSVPQDVTIVTAPPKAGGAGGASLLVRWWEG